VTRAIVAILFTISTTQGFSQALANVREALAREDAYRARFYLAPLHPQAIREQFEVNCLKVEAYLLDKQDRQTADSLVQANQTILSSQRTFDPGLAKYFTYLSSWKLQVEGKTGDAYQLVSSINVTDNVLQPAVLYKMADLERTPLRRFEDARQHLSKAIQLYRKDSAFYHFKIYRCRLLIGLTYRDLGDFDAAEKNYRIALSILDAMPEPKYDERAKILNNLGNLFRTDYAKAKPLYEESLNLRLRYVKDSAALTNAYNNLGAFYYNFGDYSSAKVYYAKALQYGTGNTASRNQLIFNYSALLNEFYEFERSEQILRTALQGTDPTHVTAIRLRLRLVETELSLAKTESAANELAVVRMATINYPANDPLLAEFHNAYSLKCYQTEDYKGMLAHIDSALAIFRQQQHQDPVLLSNLLKRRADALLRLEYLDESSAAFKRLYIQLKSYQPAHSPLLANSMLSLGEVALLRKQYDSAAVILDSALRIVSAIDGPDSARTDTERMMIHTLLAKVNAARYDSLGNPANLRWAAGHIDQASAIAAHRKQSLRSQTDRLNYGHNTYSVIPVATDIYFRQFAETPSVAISNKIFNLIEQGKAQALMQSIRDQKVGSFANVTTQVRNREEQFDMQEDELRRNLDLMMTRSETNADIFKTLSNQLIQIGKQKADFQDSLRDHLPGYYELKYNQTTVSVTELQRSLRKGQAVITYGAGENDLYAVIISAKTFRVEQIGGLDRLRSQVRLFSSLTRIHDSDSLEAVASRLYQQLIGPFTRDLKHEKISQLALIPTDALVNLPFEALISGRRKAKPIYLIEDVAVTYNYSASLCWQRLTDAKQEPTKPSMTGFAPTFLGRATQANEPTRDEEQLSYEEFSFSELPGAKHELGTIESMFRKKNIPTKTFFGEAATEQAFRAALGSGPTYIHLATHGFANPKAGARSGVAFHYDDRQKDDGLLLTDEVYSLSIPSDLAVLSACETGLGQYRNGEGVIGLTRAFFYAGVKSVVVSLWKVDDRSTSELMEIFYHERINDNRSKSQSLRDAKLNLLRKGSHPYYWSPFILVGAD
jgi:CHAT domain-containing protein